VSFALLRTAPCLLVWCWMLPAPHLRTQRYQMIMFPVCLADSAGGICTGSALTCRRCRSRGGALPTVPGHAVFQAIVVTGGTGPTHSPGCCTPGWLSLNSSTGVLSGTPDGPGFWDSRQTCRCECWHLRKRFQLGVIGTPPVLPSLPSSGSRPSHSGNSPLYPSTLTAALRYSWVVTAGSCSGMMLKDISDLNPTGM